MVHFEMAKVGDMRRKLEGGTPFILVVEDLALVSKGIMDSLEDKEVAVGNLTRFIVVGDTKR